MSRLVKSPVSKKGKSPAKKVIAKRGPAKKVVSKKSATKKRPAKKSPAKKRPAKKTVAKKVKKTKRVAKKQVKKPAKKLTKKQLRKLRQKGQPKRALSAYMYFSKANRDSIIKKHGLSTKNVLAVGKALGEAWHKLSHAEKKPYEQQAEKDRVRYQKERSAMPPKVKGPLSAYMFFVNSNRASILKKHGVSPKNIRATGKALGDSWRKLSDAEKKPYQLQAEKDKVRFQKAKSH
jgi:hypothetical protein